MGTQAGLDFCNKLAILYRGKIDQEYPLFILYNKSNIPGRPESIGIQTRALSNRPNNRISERKYLLVLKSLLNGCKVLKKSKCKFIVIPCNTAHYWYDDLRKRINLPMINMPQEVFKYTLKKCRKKSKIGLLATEGTIKTGVYNKFFDKNYKLIIPNNIIQKKSVNKAIKLVKMGNVKAASKIIKTAIDYLIKKNVRRLFLDVRNFLLQYLLLNHLKPLNRQKYF